MESQNVTDLRIVLVYPSSHQGVQSLFTFHKNEGIGLKPPLGILILATYLLSKNYRNVKCLDTQLDDLSPEQTVDRLVEMGADVVGFTVWTDFWYPVWKTIQLTRERLPDSKILLGGPHCGVYPRETLESSAADYLIVGDGEDSLLNLVRNLSQNRPVPDIPGLWRKDGDTVLPPKEDRSIIKDLTKIPAPDRLLLPYKRYSSVLNAREYETTMVTSRGCPHKCVFCKMNVQKVYARSAEQVVEEFKEIANLGITDIQIYDDTFTWSKKRVVDICMGILDNKLNLRWAIRDRVDRGDPEMYALMKKAGCYRIHFGVESGSKPILKASGKKISLEQAEYAVGLAKKNEYSTMAYYMFGFLEETHQDALKTIDFSIKLNTDYAVFAVLIPYPGTIIYNEALTRGILPYDFWLDYTRNPEPDFRIPHLIEQHMDREMLIKLKDAALRKYYFRPKKILGEIRKLTSWNEFDQKRKMAMNIVSDSLKCLSCEGSWLRRSRK